MAVNSISWKMPSKFSFYSAKSKRKIRVKPYLIEFKRLLESSITAVAGVSGFSSTIFLLKTIRVFVTKALGCCLHVNFWLLQVSNQELLHAIVALYDNCLPEITPEVLYPTVCGKWAKTLVLLRDFQGVKLCPQLPVHVTVIHSRAQNLDSPYWLPYISFNVYYENLMNGTWRLSESYNSEYYNLFWFS